MHCRKTAAELAEQPHCTIYRVPHILQCSTAWERSALNMHWKPCERWRSAAVLLSLSPLRSGIGYDAGREFRRILAAALLGI